MNYILGYFIFNIIFVLYILHNVYIRQHTEKDRNELKQELSMYLAFSLLFGAIYIIFEYVMKMLESDE